VFPLLLGSDVSTLPLRSYLSDLGYAVSPWAQGLNLGPRAGVMPAAMARLDDLYDRHSRKVSLIGWSVGGLYARELAKQAPERVRMVITLGTPLTETPRPAELWRLVQEATGREYGLPETTGPLEQAPPVPTTAIFGPSDGIVAWQDSVQPEGPMAENIGVESSHLGVGVNALVLYAIADRLAQRDGQWQPFHRQGWQASFYRNPQNEGRARSRL
jgi:pimeloyl-ACP methyl ester carboxylesterase